MKEGRRVERLTMNPNHESKTEAINERRSLKNGTASPMMKLTAHPPMTIPTQVAHPTTCSDLVRFDETTMF